MEFLRAWADEGDLAAIAAWFEAQGKRERTLSVAEADALLRGALAGAAAHEAGKDEAEVLAAAYAGRDGYEGTSAQALLEPAEVLRAMWVAGDSGVFMGIGEAGTLSGAGGLGKSLIALDCGLAAASAALMGMASGEALCGLELRAAPVAYIGFEDSRMRMGQRWRLLLDAAEEGASMLHQRGIVRSPEWLPPVERRGEIPFLFMSGRGAMYGQPPGEERAASEPLAAWQPAWEKAGEFGAGLVIIDPVASAYNGPPNDAASVRGFIDAVSAEAREIGAAVLLLAHSTKAGRREAAQGESIGADAISGSAQWYDGSRGVIGLTTPKVEGRPRSNSSNEQTLAKVRVAQTAWDKEAKDVMDNNRVMAVEKSNYGRSGQKIELLSRWLTRYRVFAGYASVDQEEQDDGRLT